MIRNTNELVLPQRHAGGYIYSDAIYGVLNHDGQRFTLPMEVITTKGPRDDAARDAALALLEAAPEGAVYEVTFERRPEEERPDWAQRWLRCGDGRWVFADDPVYDSMLMAVVAEVNEGRHDSCLGLRPRDVYVSREGHVCVWYPPGDDHDEWSTAVA